MGLGLSVLAFQTQAHDELSEFHIGMSHIIDDVVKAEPQIVQAGMALVANVIDQFLHSLQAFLVMFDMPFQAAITEIAHVVFFMFEVGNKAFNKLGERFFEIFKNAVNQRFRAIIDDADQGFMFCIDIAVVDVKGTR